MKLTECNIELGNRLYIKYIQNTKIVYKIRIIKLTGVFHRIMGNIVHVEKHKPGHII